MNRYDYYTRRGLIDEQEWLTEELYYPESEYYARYEEYDCEDFYEEFDEEFDRDDYGKEVYE